MARIWRDHDLKPWKVETFKLSNDPHFEEKLVDVVGLYLNPPERAVVFSFDEKTQVQALDRTQPILPDEAGAGRDDDPRLQAPRHHRPVRGDERRHRRGPLRHPQAPHGQRRAARSSSSSTCTCPSTSRSTSCSTTSRPTRLRRSTEWLADPKRARWHLHFTPTSSSWLNLVERWFGELTERRLRRGVFPSVTDLIDAIELGPSTGTTILSLSSGTSRRRRSSRRSVEVELHSPEPNPRRTTSGWAEDRTPLGTRRLPRRGRVPRRVQGRLVGVTRVSHGCDGPPKSVKIQ